MYTSRSSTIATLRRRCPKSKSCSLRWSSHTSRQNCCHPKCKAHFKKTHLYFALNIYCLAPPIAFSQLFVASKFLFFSYSDGELHSSDEDSDGESKGSNKEWAAEVAKSGEEPKRKRSRSGDDALKISLPDRQKSVSCKNVLTDCETWLLTLTCRASKDVEKSRSYFVTGTSRRQGRIASPKPKPKPNSSKRRYNSDEPEPNRNPKSNGGSNPSVTNFFLF